jgi:26S proteasome regulatory subunit T3
MKNLKREYARAQEEVKKIRSVPLSMGSFSEMVDDSHAIINTTGGSTYYVRVMSTIDRELLKANATVALHRGSHAVVDVLPSDADSTIQAMQMSEKPDVTYDDIGGMDMQKQEMREAVELPLQMPELYAQIGIDPPRGVLMYGPPGTGKTMMAKAVANATTATFIRVVGSEFVQKYLGEGPRMVRDVFRLARESAPAIIFIGASCCLPPRYSPLPRVGLAPLTGPPPPSPRRRGGRDWDEALRLGHGRGPRGAARADGAAHADGRL